MREFRLERPANEAARIGGARLGVELSPAAFWRAQGLRGQTPRVKVCIIEPEVVMLTSCKRRFPHRVCPSRPPGRSSLPTGARSSTQRLNPRHAGGLYGGGERVSQILRPQRRSWERGSCQRELRTAWGPDWRLLNRAIDKVPERWRPRRFRRDAKARNWRPAGASAGSLSRRGRRHSGPGRNMSVALEKWLGARAKALLRGPSWPLWAATEALLR